MKTLCLAVLVLACLAGPAAAGGNSAARAYLSWSPTGYQQDICPPGATENLYILLTNIGGFLGAEADIKWKPAGNGAGCFDRTQFTFRTGTDCHYLNRGMAVPVYVTDAPNELYVAWANNECNSSCTRGVAAYLTMEFDGCSSTQAGGVALSLLYLLDCNYLVDTLKVTRPVATVCGGRPGLQASHTDWAPEAVPDTPVEPTTWGSIKATYKR